ncbi:MAG: sigma-70 family RNA polymerase sigma factor, partial [Phycisphaeraceae bacterium]
MVHPSPLSPKRERQLIDQVHRGDRGAMGELLGAYHKQVYHLCLRMIGREADAADLAQDVLLKAVQHIDGFKGDARFSTWLYRIAMNLSISQLRRNKVRATTSLDQPLGGGDGTEEQERSALLADEREPGPVQSVQQKERLDALAEALERMDEELRGIILLRDIQEMDYQQIAEVMGVPLG